MKKFLWICLCLFVNHSFSQETDPLAQKIRILLKTINENKLEFEEATDYVVPYIDKAKNEGRYELVGKLFYFLSKKTQTPTIKHQYLDSTIYYTKTLKTDHAFPMRAYFLKGIVYDQERKYNLALDYYLLAQEAAKVNKNIEYQYYIKFNIAFLKRILGKYEQSEKLFKECQTYELQREKLDVVGYVNILFQLSSIYYESGRTEECTMINKEGISLTLKNKKKDLYNHFVVNEGINLNIKGTYNASIDSIEKGKLYLHVDDQLIAEFYLAKSYYELGKNEKALNYFKKIDTIFRNTNDLLPTLRPTYEYLIASAKKKKDKELQLQYTDQLLKLDSIIHADYRYLSNTIIRAYDIPKLVSERDDLIKDLKQNNIAISKKKNWIVKIGSILFVLVIIILSYLYLLNKKYKNRYKAVLKEAQSKRSERLQSDIKKNDTNTLESIGVDEMAIKEILKGLETFENAKYYLKNQISLNEAAKLINTNSKYLSKVINSYKKKTFTSYINDLRIDYVIDKIQHDPEYEKYTIRGIAYEGGFTSPESFLRAFYRKTGLKPSYFIKKVREEQRRIDNSLN